MDHDAVSGLQNSISAKEPSSTEFPAGEHVSTTIQSLDTVRALHQTVVCLRSALEDAHREINQLKKQISVNEDIDSGKEFRRSVDNLSEALPTIVLKTQNEPQLHQTPIVVKSTPELSDTKLDSKSPSQRSNHHKHHQGSYSFSVCPDDIRVNTFRNQSADRRNKPMASKIDVKIKVSSNIKVNEALPKDSSEEEEATTSQDNNSGSEATSHETDQSDTDHHHQVNTTSSANPPHSSANEENRPNNPSGSISSEGENSVFEDQKASRVPAAKQHENSEEVDDIELIFSSDDKDFGHDDLVSIGGDYEPWEKAGSSGTPVLVNFASVGSDQESGDAGNATKMDKGEANESMEDVDQENQGPIREETEINRDDSYDNFEPVSNSSVIGLRWTNHNVLIETDISKCGISEETSVLDMGRRNTCPNPPAYRPIIHREAIAAANRQQASPSGRTPLAVKFSRNSRSHQQYYPMQSSVAPRSVAIGKQQPPVDERTPLSEDTDGPSSGPKRSTSVQTEISALPEHWRSESHLVGDRFCGPGFYTLPSKFVPPPSIYSCHRYAAKVCIKSQEARRVLLSDINFTSMVPELSRSADHLCQEKQADTSDSSNQNNNNNNLQPNNTSFKGHNHLPTPDGAPANRGITPSFSMTTSPGVSQWTVHENSYGTQTTQTDNHHFYRGDSFDSSKSYSLSSRYSSNPFAKSHRSRSVPSVRCAMCKLNHHGLGMRTSESMHYTPRVTFHEPTTGGAASASAAGRTAVRGSLPDLRNEHCGCSAGGHHHRRSHQMHRKPGDSSGSTDSLLDEADDYLMHGSAAGNGLYDYGGTPAATVTAPVIINLRRYSENDIKRDYSPSKNSLPFLPKSPKCLKLDHLAKVITKTGRVVVGRVRYIGPLAGQSDYADDVTFVGLQLPSKVGDCDGSIDGRRFFDCEPQHGTFVPFKKIIMAWTS